VDGDGDPEGAAAPDERAEEHPSNDRQQGLGPGFFHVQGGERKSLHENGVEAESGSCPEEHESAPQVFPADPVEQKERLVDQEDGPVLSCGCVVGVLLLERRAVGEHPGAYGHEGKIEGGDECGEAPVPQPKPEVVEVV